MATSTIAQRKRARMAEFGPIWGGSGVQNFHQGDGYWYSQLLRRVGIDVIRRMTHVAKTTTIDRRAGYMPLAVDGITPRDWWPDCIRINFREAAVLNSVGLSGPGFKYLLDQDRWQVIEDPFFLSFMPVGVTPEEREQEVIRFVTMLIKRLPAFKTRRLGIQVNVSCPNAKHELLVLIGEVMSWLDILSDLPEEIVLVIKINTLMPIPIVGQIADHPRCDGLCISNTIPWGKYPEIIDWERLFGSTESPLAHIGGGGLSGRPIVPIVLDYIADVSAAVDIDINGGGGIIYPGDPLKFRQAGASSCFYSSGLMVRPWHGNGVVDNAHYVYRHGA